MNKIEKNTELNRMNIKLPAYIQDYYKKLGEKYSVPYTNYISMILTQIYEKEQEKELVNEFNNTLKDLKQISGDVTTEEMMKQFEDMKKMMDKLDNE